MRAPAEGFAPSATAGQPNHLVMRGWELRTGGGDGGGDAGDIGAVALRHADDGRGGEGGGGGGGGDGLGRGGDDAGSTTATHAYIVVKLGSASTARAGDDVPVLNVLDFAAVTGVDDQSESSLMRLLSVVVQHMLPHATVPSEPSGEAGLQVIARVPAALLSPQSALRKATIVAEPPSHVWMYRSIGTSPAAADAVRTLVSSECHYVAPIDEY
jgi:hypothetical protein